MNSPPLPAAPTAGIDRIPLVVDIDAFFGIDTMIKSVMASMRNRPGLLLQLPRWLARGWVGISQGLAAHERTAERRSRCYSPEVLDYL
jgi:hypothetical protein